GDRVRLGGMPLLHAFEPTLLRRSKPLALDRGAVHDDGTLGGQSLTQGTPQRAHVMAVDHTHVGEIELLPPQAGRPERLDRLLDVGTEALKCRPDACRELGQAALDSLA